MEQQEPQYTEEELQALEDAQEEAQAEATVDSEEARQELSEEMQELYGAPEPEEVLNQHAYLDRATFKSGDTVRTTLLTEQELGRPLFNVRFLMDLKDLSKHYFDPIIKELGFDIEKDNRIATYFEEKIQNITGSGMSRDGFAMNLNVTKKLDATRKRYRENPIENLKGGKKQ